MRRWGLLERAMPMIHDWSISLLPAPVVPPTRAWGPCTLRSSTWGPVALSPTTARRLAGRPRMVFSSTRGPERTDRFSTHRSSTDSGWAARSLPTRVRSETDRGTSLSVNSRVAASITGESWRERCSAASTESESTDVSATRCEEPTNMAVASLGPRTSTTVLQAAGRDDISGATQMTQTPLAHPRSATSTRRLRSDSGGWSSTNKRRGRARPSPSRSSRRLAMRVSSSPSNET